MIWSPSISLAFLVVELLPPGRDDDRLALQPLLVHGSLQVLGLLVSPHSSLLHKAFLNFKHLGFFNTFI